MTREPKMLGMRRRPGVKGCVEVLALRMGVVDGLPGPRRVCAVAPTVRGVSEVWTPRARRLLGVASRPQLLGGATMSGRRRQSLGGHGSGTRRSDTEISAGAGGDL